MLFPFLIMNAELPIFQITRWRKSGYLYLSGQGMHFMSNLYIKLLLLLKIRHEASFESRQLTLNRHHCTSSSLLSKTLMNSWFEMDWRKLTQNMWQAVQLMRRSCVRHHSQVLTWHVFNGDCWNVTWRHPICPMNEYASIPFILVWVLEAFVAEAVCPASGIQGASGRMSEVVHVRVVR